MAQSMDDIIKQQLGDMLFVISQLQVTVQQAHERIRVLESEKAVLEAAKPARPTLVPKPLDQATTE